ncbi:MFS transporter [Micromonospora sp. NPDC051141]|uniref:MFS transporter n=1 Tax=Micromonospora sp. NPDC051141 TaxID=3364284 RepID=UPI0037B191E6
MTTSRLSALALPLICLAQLMATLDVTIVNLALPAVQTEFALSNASLAWVIDAYTLTYGGLLLLGGRAGDLFGHRRTLVVGVLLFTASSLLGGLARDESVLLTARAIQGLGAALATPTTLSLITTLHPPGPRRNKAMIAYGAMAGLGITLGLVLGGILTEAASWRWVFLVNVPIGLLLAVAAPKVLPDTAGRRRRLDLLGALSGTAALTALVYGVIRAGGEGWDDRAAHAALVLSVLLVGVFVKVERAVAEPMLPLSLLRHRTRLGAYLIAMLLFACLYPSFFFLTRALQDVFARRPMETGLQFLPIGVGVLIFAVATRRFVPVYGARRMVVGGTAAAMLAALWLAQLDAGDAYVTMLLPCLVGLGAGVGTTFVANAAAAMTDVPEHETGIASGLLSTFQAVGGTVGVAVLASVAARVTEDQVADAAALGLPSTAVVQDAVMSGFARGFVLAAVLAGLACAVAISTSPGRATGLRGPAPRRQPVAVLDDDRG